LPPGTGWPRGRENSARRHPPFRFPEPDKQRPVVVLSRDSIIDRLSRITVAPLTSTIRGVASEVVLGPDDGMKDAYAINLHNIVTVPKAGLGRLLINLDARRLDQVVRGVRSDSVRPRLRPIGSGIGVSPGIGATPSFFG
jgi:mRNA interferase MazF